MNPLENDHGMANSNGMPIHPTTDGTAAFWHWFGASKAVDEQGQPLVLYHGTRTQDPSGELVPGGRAGSIQSGDAYGVGLYFTSCAREASWYARETGAVMPFIVRGALLDLDKPLSPAESQKLTSFAESVLRPSDKARFEMGRTRKEFSELELARDFFACQRENWRAFGDNMDRAFPEALIEGGKYIVEFTDFEAPITISTGQDAFKMFSAVGWDNVPASGFDGVIMARDGGHSWVVLHRPDGNVKSSIEVAPYLRSTASPHRLALLKSPGFRHWFADSKVVDRTGVPLVVYHGTAIEKDSFNREGGGAGIGAYFTDDPELASDFAEMDGGVDGEPAHVIPVYLSLQNPYMAEGIESQSITSARRDELIAMGHDGVIGVFGDVREFVAFEPTQVKSAIGNDGSFDPADPSLIGRHHPCREMNDAGPSRTSDILNALLSACTTAPAEAGHNQAKVQRSFDP